MKYRFNYLICTTFLLFVAAVFIQESKAQRVEDIFKAAGTPSSPKVTVSWNRYNTYDGISSICDQLVKAYPNLISKKSIGKSYEGRDIWVLEITDSKTLAAQDKPGFYIDGNIHSNEIQGSEISLYTAWYLVESFNENAFINTLLKEKVFYIVPTINPDARDNFMKAPNTANTPRSGMIPFDDDRDGLEDEDGLDDVNGDGHVTYMRRKNPNGRYKIDPENPKWLIRADPDEAGQYEFLGTEGFDNDGDGMVNEDRVGGYYDPNRDWGWDWQPDYIQFGALKYPFSVPENRAVAEFVMAHPNIAGAQSYHNSGGMILRGPGSASDEASFHDTDKPVYDAIGKLGAKIIPGYEYMVLFADLYPAFGGELSWFHGGRGIFTFTNELFTSKYLFNKDYKNYNERMKDAFDFDKYLLFEDSYVEWTPYDHPIYGEIEVGGFKRNYSRANPGFLLESDAHRNMAFTIFHAYHTPKLVVEEVKEKDLGKGLKEITVTIANKRMIPTHSGNDVQNKINPPDYIGIEGAEVIAGMIVLDEDLKMTKEQKFNPEQIEVQNIPGMGVVTVRWIISGEKDFSINVDSQKGGKLTWSKKS
jgi:hypothetical protein